MYIVHSGRLAVNKQLDAGRILRMGGLEPGDFFGEMTLIEMQNRSATVIAETATTLYELTAQNLYRSTKRTSTLCNHHAEYQSRALPPASSRRRSRRQAADTSCGTIRRHHARHRRNGASRQLPACKKKGRGNSRGLSWQLEKLPARLTPNSDCHPAPRRCLRSDRCHSRHRNIRDARRNARAGHNRSCRRMAAVNDDAPAIVGAVTSAVLVADQPHILDAAVRPHQRDNRERCRASPR